MTVWLRRDGGRVAVIEVVNLALPYFGLIFIGFVSGKIKKIPLTGLAWMDFFIVYVTLPALFYRILAKMPIEELAQVSFVVGTTLTTLICFVLSFSIGLLIRREIPNATIAGLAGGYGNIGYMGPGLVLATIGPGAAVPVALIFCFDSILLFSLVPFLMALSSRSKSGFGPVALEVVKRIALHPLLIASALGVLSAAADIRLPQSLDRLLEFLQGASAPAALFTLGVTVALRPLTRVPAEIPILATVKLVIAPVIALLILSTIGNFEPNWVYAAVLMAALPPALNVFVFARQYNTWIEEASSSVLFGTAISVVTLTAVMWLVKTKNLPLHLFSPG